MLVYGDHEERSNPRQIARSIRLTLEELTRSGPGLQRHARLVAVLIEAGRLLQGLADAAFADGGQDRLGTDELSEFLLQLGRAVCRSWDSGISDVCELPPLRLPPDMPAEVTLKIPEGFAFYALYPEAYIEAARRLCLSAPPRVIGIRSIGTTLAAVVAAALRAPQPLTVRPFGDPSDRRIAIEPNAARELLEGNAHYVIVDEGPGLSGSSFAAVAEWLIERGVAPDRIAALPSHAGMPGAAASTSRRRWWRSVQRQAGDFGDSWPVLIERWCSASLGAVDVPVQEISAGAWRGLRYTREDDWPPVVASWERRKFLVRAGGEQLLVKFAGLGAIGEEKLRIARALHSQGLVPEPLQLLHGFLVERWCAGAAPLASEDTPLQEIASYLGRRAKLLPVADESGASIEQLIEMVRRNVSLELGASAATLGFWEDRAGELGRRVVRMRTDNKLDRHEWLREASGALIKTDAVDHHQAHDLIGCQDLAWDVAGAIVEFDLDGLERERFLDAVAHETGHRLDRELLQFYGIAYPAFRLGQARLGATMVSNRAEQERIGRAGDRYAARLRRLLQASWAATRPKSSLD